MTEWRWDPITGQRVIIAEGRAARPVDYPAPPPGAASSSCPFCEGNEALTPAEVAVRRAPSGPPNGRGWSVRVIPNKFPTFLPSVSPSSVSMSPPGSTLRREDAVGVHEVVIQSPTHSPGFPYLGSAHQLEVFEVYRERVRALEPMPGARSIVLAENWGPDSGGSLSHPHGQILATTELVPGLADMLRGSEERAREWQVPCPLEHVLDEERRIGSRIVLEDEHITVLAPFASTFPYQVRFIPREHRRSLSRSGEGELRSLAVYVPRVERALLALFPGASYNMAGVFPVGEADVPRSFHWWLDLLPRLGKGDAFELAAHVPVNPVPPEAAAEQYRRALSSPGDGRAP